MNPFIVLWLLHTMGGKGAASSPGYPSPRHPPPRHPKAPHAPQAAPAAPPPHEAAPAAAEAHRGKKEAALELWNYVTHALKSPSTALKLARGPDPTVRQAQADMGMPVPHGQEGWYGAKTRAFAQQILGRPFPPPPPHVPVHLSVPHIP